MDLHLWKHFGVVSLIWLLTMLVAVLVGWALTVFILRLARVDQGFAHVGTPDGPAALLDRPAQPTPILRGGLWIGILERIAVASAIMSGHPELIAVVVAVKGLGRYPELKDNPAASERFLIGTGASLLLAAATGMCGSYALVLLV